MIIESEFSDNAEGEEIFKKHLTLKFRYDIISTLTIWQRIKYAGVAELADALASGSVTTVDLSACRFPVHISCGAVCEKPTSVLDLSRVRSFKFLYADVAELADALASGASDRKVVWVQVPSPAP